MANVSYKLKDLEQKKTIRIGYVGENNHMHVRIDCEEVFKEYPNAAVTMAITPPEGEDYPKVVTRDGNVVEWTVANSDVAAEGYGEFQMTFTEGEVIRKTVTASFEVIRSIVGNGTAPSGIDDFLTDANAKLAAVDEAIQDAEDAASHTPTIGNDGYWYRWDADQGEYVSTGTKAQGEQGDPGSPGDPTQLIDDTAGEGATGKTWSADKLDEEITDVKNDIQGMSESVEASDGFLEMNDLDAEVGGKTNTLITPYELTDMINNSIILSNGSIRTEGSSSDTSKMVTPLVEVVAGKTYGLKIHKRSTVGDIAYSTNYGYGLYASDGSTPVARSNQSSLGDDIYLFDIPQGAKYIRFIIGKGVNGDTNNEEVLQHFNQWILLPDADSTVDDSFFVITTPKENGEIDRIKRIDGSYLKLKDTQAREDVAEALAMPITFGRRTCAIFEKVCCIGDSYTAGYIYNSSGTPETNNKYSWVEHLKNMTGRDYVNCGISGATSKSWLSDADGLAKAQVSANKAQAYIIALQINDAAQGLTVGTVSDIGTSNQTYIGCTSKIIDEMFNINDDAHIFLLTQPKNYVSDHTPYRQAILDIVAWYQTTGNGTHQNQVHLIDLLDYWKLFRNPGCHDSSANGHYTAVGWEYTAEIIMYAWSNYLNEHPLLFQDVNLIPYGTT